jgi:hypothetical protein
VIEEAEYSECATYRKPIGLPLNDIPFARDLAMTCRCSARLGARDARHGAPPIWGHTTPKRANNVTRKLPPTGLV